MVGSPEHAIAPAFQHLSQGVTFQAVALQASPTFVEAVSSNYAGTTSCSPVKQGLSSKHDRLPQAAVKRALDVAVSALFLVLLLPMFAIVAILIKLTDGGPVLFWQTRVGRHGREFWFPKFRSMVPKAELMLTTLLEHNHHKTGVTFKIKRDPRVTWIGRIIRRASVDELPQLWCVLTGSMTLVGPRPAVPREVAQYTAKERGRLLVTPGLTCIWQVSGRGDIPFAQQVEMDLEYIQRQSLWLDTKILFMTFPAVLTGRGAY